MLHLRVRRRVRVLAEKAAHQVARRVLEHLLGRGHLHDAAALHENDRIRQLERLAHVVRDEDDGLVQLLLQALDLVLQRLARHGVERAERLVHQYDGRGCGQRAQHADALLLPAGQLGGVLVRVLLHVHHGQHLLHDLGAARLVVLEQLRHDADVLRDRHVRKQADLLDDVADVAAQLDLVGLADVLSADADGAGIRLDEPVDGLQSRRLPAAGGADQDHELPVRDREGQVLQNGGFSITFANVFKFDHAVRSHSFMPGFSPRREPVCCK